MCPEAHRRSASPSAARGRPRARESGVGRARTRTTSPAAQPSGTRSLDGKPVAARGGGEPPVYRPEDLSRRNRGRSEEHTSELQSLAYLVCRLLLEKKKKKE